MRKSLGLLAALLALLGLAWMLRTPDVPLAELKAAYASPASRFLPVNGMEVHVRDEGPRDAPALLLIHGSNASLHSWEPWVQRLSREHRVVTLDLQGHGLTGPAPNGCYTAACMADTVEGVRRALGIRRMAVGGNSMGGGVALAYALAHPGRAQALLLVDAAGAPVQRDGPPPIGFRIAQTPVLRDLAAHFTPRSVIADTLTQSVSVKSVATEAAIDRYWRLLRAPGNRQATMERFAEARAPYTTAQLAPLAQVPTLILWGAEDRLIPLEAGRWFHKALPQSRLIVYPGIGHLPQEEAPDRSAADVRAFLGTLQPGG